MLVRGNYSEVNNKNSSSVHTNCHPELTTAFKRPKQRGCLTEVLQFLRCA